MQGRYPVIDLAIQIVMQDILVKTGKQFSWPQWVVAGDGSQVSIVQSAPDLVEVFFRWKDDQQFFKFRIKHLTEVEDPSGHGKGNLSSIFEIDELVFFAKRLGYSNQV